MREVVSWQAGSWVARVVSTFFFLRAFHVDATAKTTLAVLVVAGLSTMLPFTPGGAGTQQAILVFALGRRRRQLDDPRLQLRPAARGHDRERRLGFGAILIMLGTLRWRHRVQGAEDEQKQPPSAPDASIDVPPSPPPVAADRDRI